MHTPPRAGLPSNTSPPAAAPRCGPSPTWSLGLPLPGHPHRVQSGGAQQDPRGSNTQPRGVPRTPTATARTPSPRLLLAPGLRTGRSRKQGRAPRGSDPSPAAPQCQEGEATAGHVPAGRSAGTAGWTGAASAGARRSWTASSAASSCGRAPQTASSAEWTPDSQSYLI